MFDAKDAKLKARKEAQAAEQAAATGGAPSAAAAYATPAGLTRMAAQLAGHNFLGGNKPSAADQTAYVAVGAAAAGSGKGAEGVAAVLAGYPIVTRWHNLVSMFTPEVREKWA